MLDLHTHVWPHQPGTPTPTYDQLAHLCDVAAAAGITEIAVTEHSHRFRRIRDEVLVHWDHSSEPNLVTATTRVLDVEGGADLDAYVEALVAAKARGLPLLVGLEVDRIPGAMEPMAAVLDDYPLDVRLGSVHWLDSWLFDDYGTPAFAREWETRSVSEVWATYVEAVSELSASGMVDVLAHLDVIKVAGHRPEDLKTHEARLVDVVLASGLAVEVSSAGWRKPANEMYPSPTLLDALTAAGVPVTTSSDAHVPEHLGWGFDRLRTELANRGVRELTTFADRTPRTVAL